MQYIPPIEYVTLYASAASFSVSQRMFPLIAEQFVRSVNAGSPEKGILPDTLGTTIHKGVK